MSQRRQGKHRPPVREVVWLLPYICYCLWCIDGAILRMHAQLGKADIVMTWVMSMFNLGYYLTPGAALLLGDSLNWDTGCVSQNA